MECNKRNQNIRYAIFRDSNLKKLSEHLVLESNIFLYFCDRFSKLKRFFSVFEPIIFMFLADLSKRNVALFWEWLYKVLLFLIFKSYCLQLFQSIKYQCYPHIETSQLICCANQLTGFYMRPTLALNGLNTSSHKRLLEDFFENSQNSHFTEHFLMGSFIRILYDPNLVDRFVMTLPRILEQLREKVRDIFRTIYDGASLWKWNVQLGSKYAFLTGVQLCSEIFLLWLQNLL